MLPLPYGTALQFGSPALVGADGERLDLPDAVFRLLRDIVRNMQLGRAIVLVPENQQLTTQRTADLLGVSRPHLIKLLETGGLPYHKVGSHRRVYLKDLVAYQKRRDLERKAALNRIAKEPSSRACTSGLACRRAPRTNEGRLSRPARRLRAHTDALGRCASTHGRGSEALPAHVVATNHG